MVTEVFITMCAVKWILRSFGLLVYVFTVCDGIVAMRVANGTKKSYGEVSW
jgi:hypothetical protein